MKTTYQLQTRHGLLTVDLMDDWTCRCRLHDFLAGIKPRPYFGDGPPPRPFPEIESAHTYLAFAEETMARMWPTLRHIPANRKMLIEFCLGGGRGALELFEDCPALALLLALRISNDSSVFRCEQVVGIVAAERRELLKYCWFREKRWVARLLRKVYLPHLTPELLDELKIILRRSDPDQWKILRHLPRINSLIVFVLRNPVCAGIATNYYYLDAAMYPQQNGDIEAECLLDEIIEMAKEFNELPMPRLDSVRELPELYDCLRAQVQKKKEYPDRNNRDFRPPPIPGGRMEEKGLTGGILPITTAEEIDHEGRKMNHCIGSYIDTIAGNENLYAYHAFLGRETASVLIERTPAGWRVREIRGVNNRRVSNRMLHCVGQWLAHYNSINMKTQERPERTLSTP